MGWSYWGRVLLMICSFVAIVITISKLETKGLHKRVQETLGINEATQSFMWCRTRVKTINIGGQKVLWQEGMEWKSPSKTLPQIDIEKWFGSSCRLVYSPAQGSFSDPPKRVEIEFIDGSKSAFLRNANGLWQWESVTFASPMWDLQLAELEKMVLH